MILPDKVWTILKEENITASFSTCLATLTSGINDSLSIKMASTQVTKGTSVKQRLAVFCDQSALFTKLTSTASSAVLK